MICLLLILIIEPDGYEVKQVTPFDTRAECHEAIKTYDGALNAIDWDIALHGQPTAMCVRIVSV